MGKTKGQILRTIRTEYDIAPMRCEHIQSPHIVAFAKELHERSSVGSAATPPRRCVCLSTANVGIPLDKAAMDDALTVCRTMGITAKSAKLHHRPTSGN